MGAFSIKAGELTVCEQPLKYRYWEMLDEELMELGAFRTFGAQYLKVAKQSENQHMKYFEKMIGYRKNVIFPRDLSTS